MKYNPFNPNAIVSSNLFAGRTEYVWRIIRKLEQVKRGMPASFFLFGERGIGKTALAKLIKHIAEVKDPKLGKLNFLCSYYSVENGQPIISVLESSLNELTDKIPKSVMEILGQKLGGLFDKGKFSIGPFLSVEVSKRQSKDRSVKARDQLVSILSNVIESIIKPPKDESCEEAKDGVLLIIDEMDNLKDAAIGAQLLRGIITTLDVKELGNISFLLIGYQISVEEFFKGDPSARRYFDSIELGVMPIGEAKEVLIKGFTEAEVKWEEEALNKYISVTGGYPHSIQLIGHNILEMDNDDHIDEEDWGKAISITAFELQRKDFATMYQFDGRPSGREAILDLLAVANKPLSKSEIQRFCRISNIYQYLPELIKRGSIRKIPSSDKIELHSQLLRTSILMHIFSRRLEEGYLEGIEERIMKEANENNKS